MVSAAGGRRGYVARTRQDVYRALRKSGASKAKAAAVANAGVSKAGRKTMARKAAATRRRRGGRR